MGIYAYALVFLGGGLGSICRYGISVLLQRLAPTFPLATFLANALSCFILGVLLSLSIRDAARPAYTLLLVTGFCGGFSTFSTFSNETLRLFQQGHLTTALANISLSLAVGLSAIYFGAKLVH